MKTEQSQLVTFENALIKRIVRAKDHLDAGLWLLRGGNKYNSFTVSEIIDLYSDDIDLLKMGFDELKDQYGDVVPTDPECWNHVDESKA
jgi:cyanate lyase